MSGEARQANDARWLSTAEAAARLGVKPETVYAYVSRGLLPRHRAADGRSSRFHAADVEALATRGRARGQSRRDGHDVVVRSALTEIREGRMVRYRGHDVAGLVAAATFEEVAELLWTGVLPSEVRWAAAPDALAMAQRVQHGLTPEASLLDRLRLALDAAATVDPLRHDLRPEAVRAAARSLLPTLVRALPPPDPPRPLDPPRSVEALGHIWPEPSTQPGERGGDGPGGRGGDGPGGRGGHGAARRRIAETLWTRLSPEPPAPASTAALDAALVLLADHELAPSTFAVRVAASARCDPYAVIACGLAVVSGTRHGAAGLAVEELLAQIREPDDAAAAMARLLRRGAHLPGFGHVLYSEADPRAVLLLERLRALFAGDRRLGAVERVLAVAAERGLPPPNVDFALAALTHLAGMPPGSASVLFAVARCGGWFAHALEQYAEEDLLRPRAVYTGP